MTTLLGTYVKVSSFTEVNAACAYIREQSEVFGWPKSLNRHLVDALDKHDDLYISVGKDGVVVGHEHAPKNLTEVKFHYKTETLVREVTIERKVIKFMGKDYYADELEEALRGCEVK